MRLILSQILDQLSGGGLPPEDIVKIDDENLIKVISMLNEKQGGKNRVVFTNFYDRLKFMKVLKIIILLVTVISFLPLDGFCADDHNVNTQAHHCVISCHTCHQAVAPDTKTEFPNLTHSTSVSFNYSFHYQSPILDQAHRPPKVSL